MDKKKLPLLVGALVLLLLAAWMSGIFSAASTLDVPEVSINTDDVTSIAVSEGDDQIKVSRSEGGGWTLVEPVAAEADTTTANNILRQLSDFQIEGVVSSKPDRYGRFEVDDAASVRIELEGAESLIVYVGKSGPDFQSRYVRIEGDERVYLATGVPSAVANVDRWREKSLWDYPAESIVRVDVTTPDGSLRLSKADGGWVLEEDGTTQPADSAKVERYLRRIAAVRADGFLLDVASDSVLSQSTHAVEIERIDGSISRLAIQERESDAAAVHNGTGDVIKLNSYRVKNFAPGPDELLPDAD